MDEIPAEAFYDYAGVADPAVSPSGDRVAFVTAEFDPDEDERRSSVFVVPTDGSQDPHRLTRVSDASSPTWSPDGDRLGVVMAREEDVELGIGRDEDDEENEDEDDEGNGDNGESEDEAVEGADDDGDKEDDGSTGSDDDPKPQVWVYDLGRGGDARQVTDFEEGVSAFDWGPDGDRVVVAARDPTDEQAEYLERKREGGPIEVERLQHKHDSAGWLDEVREYLFVVDCESRERERIDEAYARGAGSTFGGIDPAWHPEDDRIAFRSYRGEDPDDTVVQDVYTVDPDGDDLRRITDGNGAVSGLTWSPDGSHLAFASRPADNWYHPTEAYVADPETGEYGSVSADLDRTLSWGGTPRWLDDRRLLALVGDEARTRFVRLSVDGDPERVPAAQGADEAVQWFDVADDGDRIACVRSAPTAGTDVFAFDRDDLDATPVEGGIDAPDDPRTRLTDRNADLLAEYEFPESERITFESEGTGDEPAEIEAVAYYPDDFDADDPDPRPLLLWIHGGPMAYDEPAFKFDDGFWTSRGYVVWKVNYRGSTSYGRDFCESLRGRWNSVEVADLQAGVDEAIERGWADPDRLFVGGFSQGGINTGFLVTRTDRFAAAAAEHGIYDMRSAFGTDDSHNWWESDYGLPWENPEDYEEASSIPDVGNVTTPTLVTAGENDWRCPPSQAEQFYVSIRKQGVPAKLVIYQDEHHDIGDPDRAIHRLETLAEWFEDHDPTVDSEADGDGDDAGE